MTQRTATNDKMLTTLVDNAVALPDLSLLPV